MGYSCVSRLNPFAIVALAVSGFLCLAVLSSISAARHEVRAMTGGESAVSGQENNKETVEFLSDLTFKTVSNGLGPIERDASNGSNGAGDGKQISINGVKYARGLGVHANSELRYCLGGQYKTFIAEVGVDDGALPNGSVEFQVWADKDMLFSSGAVAYGAAVKKVNVSLVGRKQLRLVVLAGANAQGDQADWADARLVRVGVPPPAPPASTLFLSDLNFSTIINGAGPVEKDQSNGEAAAGDGKPLTINGVSHKKGLGVSVESEVCYCLEGRFSTFIADVGVDDAATSSTPVAFQVFADGLLLYESGAMQRGTPSKAVVISVLGKNELTLVVRAVGGSATGSQADWAGARLVAAHNAPSEIGQWTAPEPWPFVSVHLSVLPNGKVLTWRASFAVGADVRVWDPSVNSFIPALPPSRTPVNNIFCSGHSFLADGRLLVTGGHVKLYGGTPYTNIYDFNTNKWSAAEDMNDARWYPTNCTLGNAEVLVLGGSIGQTGTDPPVMNTLPQVWKDGVGYRSLSSAILRLPLYPWTHLAPDGRVFNSGPNKTTRFLDTSGNGRWSIVGDSSFGFRDYGSSVMYDNGKVLIMGGGNRPDGENRPTNTAEIIDLTTPSPVWSETGRMSHERRQLNATLLPDGQVLVIGGTSGSGFNDEANPVYPAEVWNPETGRWTTLASMTVPRLYHSTAVLLPDGRVMSAGGGFSAPYHDYLNVEFYSPPYLFRGARPSITSAAGSVAYKDEFRVETPDAADVAAVTWVRLPSVTHSFDHNLRINRLTFMPAPGGLKVTAPADKNLCPPGHYMMFLINKRGVPSVAKIIRVTAPA
jgi:hypothetical protein